MHDCLYRLITGGKTTGGKSAQKQIEREKIPGQPLGIEPKASDFSCWRSDH